MTHSKIFTTQEIKAILTGSKTQFRELVKQRITKEGNGNSLEDYGVLDKHGNFIEIEEGNPATLNDLSKFQPGDIIYCREAWCRYQPVIDVKRADGACYTEISDGFFAYKADGFDNILEFKRHTELMLGCSCSDVIVEYDKWQSPATMPRNAARLFLMVKSVEVQRLNEISESDAIAEGIEKSENFDWYYKDYINSKGNTLVAVKPIISFSTLYESKHGHNTFNSNFCFKVVFEVVEKPKDF